MLVVHEDDAVADEHLVLDDDPGAEERVALDLAPPADRHAVLDLDERPDHGVVADRAPVQIDEREDPDACAEADVVHEPKRGVVGSRPRLPSTREVLLDHGADPSHLRLLDPRKDRKRETLACHGLGDRSRPLAADEPTVRR